MDNLMDTVKRATTVFKFSLNKDLLYMYDILADGSLAMNLYS